MERSAKVRSGLSEMITEVTVRRPILFDERIAWPGVTAVTGTGTPLRVA
ncbi:hypothetical protein [Actinoallomurus iriomotensis]|uniref:Uncharacterized protein n=1 Tax=Actinoallomurus iriomotensis TaxID=478107 RepID=A0A9W6W0D4_9ACTN|nr:hypothetical protein [Actinoallomurus iriomotensis]GLY92183.1 hypothetical protein Airi02_101110 [Actinoallomurus iriomotensis]